MNAIGLKIFNNYLRSEQTHAELETSSKVSDENLVQLIYKPEETDSINNLSLIKISIVPRGSLGPTLFNVDSLFYFIAGKGFLKTLDDEDIAIERREIGPETCLILPIGSKHMIVNESDETLVGLLINTPPWSENVNVNYTV